MIQNWLVNNAPGYDELSEEEKSEIMHFSLLWSLFEARVLNTSASPRSIQTKINSPETAELLDHTEFENYRNYFSQRYIENGNTNFRFPHLHFRRNDNQGLVERVLKYETNDVSEVVIALLTIVYRYRNNFFHGIKWAYKFKEQLDNFRISNELLIQMLEIHNPRNNLA